MVLHLAAKSVSQRSAAPFGSGVHYDALISIMHRALLEEAGYERLLEELTSAVAAAAGVERVSIWRLNAAGNAITAEALFHTSEAHHSSGQVIHRDDAPAYFEAIRGGEVVDADDARSDPRTREFTEGYLIPEGITSMLDAPILVGGRLDGVVCMEHVGPPRVWSAVERTFAVSVANVAALLIVERARAEAEEEARESRRRLETLMSHLPGMAYRCRNNPDWTMEVVSEGVQRLTGHEPSEFLANGGVRFTDLVHPEDRQRVWDEVQRAIRDSTPFELTYRIRTRNGEERWVWEQGRSVGVGEDGVVAIEGFITDITERKHLEHQLAEGRRMESVGRLAGGIAHDFNNLLSVILGTLELVGSDLPETDPHHQDLDDIRKAGERAASLTRQLLAFSRRQVVKPKPVDLNGILREMLRLRERLIGDDVTVVFRPGDDLHLVEVDPAQVEQVLSNLVVNARDAMPGGGSLVLETRNVGTVEEGGPMDESGEPGKGPGVLLTVADTGCGMDEATVERAFEPFFTTKSLEGGSGLGLSTVYGIVQQSGGKIEIESQVGEGTTVRVWLPALRRPTRQEAESPGMSETAPTAVPANQEKRTILVVDDEENLAQVAGRLLERMGFAVLRASGGEEALTLLESHPEPVDLLFTDVVMPGMSGPQVAQEVQARSPATRVLFTSGYTHDVLGRHGLRPESIAFLPKPYTGEELFQRIGEVLPGV